MSAQPEYRLTETEYLQQERDSDTKHDYFDGHIIAMAGASRKHVLITSSTSFLLYGQLRGRKCELYLNDMRIKVEAINFFAYPDLAVVCGETHFADEHSDTLLNPSVIIEVLSPSTERYDRGLKFQNYRMLPSLQDYVMISQDQPRIERYSRHDDDNWMLTEAIGLEKSIALPAIQCELFLRDVYEQINFEEHDA